MSEDVKEVMFAPLCLKQKIKMFFEEHEKPKVQIIALSFKRDHVSLIRQPKCMQETTL